MFEYYTLLLIVTISIMISAVIVIYNDNILEKSKRTIFICSHLTIVLSYFFEWLAIYLGKNNSNMHFVMTFTTGFIMFSAPSVMAGLALGINDIRTKRFLTIICTIIALNFIVGLSALFSDAIFYYDEQNIYHRGDYFIIHFIMIIISVLTLLITTIKLGLKYQNKNNYILGFAIIIFLGGLLTHFGSNDVLILWICATVAFGIFYIYYSSFINQIDILTGILNRKCYDSQLYDIKTNAILLMFDLNKFKEINDTHGHAAGDYCLVEIAKAIKEVYGKSGYCYRIGGDEFSVILYKNLDSLEELNKEFNELISQKKYTLALPSVSIGHSYYDPNESSIQKVIEEADIMMYALKQQKAL